MYGNTDVAVIGAGPYGLSIAAHLAEKGVAHKIFGVPMQTWRERMPAGMTLKSDPFASNLSDPARRYTLRAYRQSIGEPYDDTAWLVPLETFVAYGEWFQSQVAPDVDRRDVRWLETAPDGFRLTLDDGAGLTARQVVVAAGVRDYAYLPPEFAALSPAVLSHSSHVADPARFAGRDVTLIGAGASAIDLLALLHEAGATARLVARAPKLVFFEGDQQARSLIEKLRRPTTGVGPGWRNLFVCQAPSLFARLPDSIRRDAVRRMLGPAAGRGVRERIGGKAEVVVGCRVIEAHETGSGVQLHLATPEGSQRIETEHVIAATGYRPDIARLPFLSPKIVARLKLFEGAPRLSMGFETTVPGLHFVGLSAAYAFGPVQRFVFGARFAAKAVAKRLG